MSNYDVQRPYLASYVIFRSPEGKVALLLRTGDRWMSGYWGLPSGKVEKDESFTSCAVREIKEEVGVALRPADLKLVFTEHRHELEDQENNWVDIFFEATDWGGELTNAEPEAHSQLKWFSPDNLPDNMVPNVQTVLTKLQRGEYFAELNWEESQ